MSHEASLFDGLEDIALECEECIRKAEFVRDKRSNEPIWITSDGRAYYISEMATEHIRNCIKLIYQKNGTWRHKYLRYFEQELRRRRVAKRNFDEDPEFMKRVGRMLKKLGNILENR